MPNCPKCSGELIRIYRSTLERAVSLVYPMRRFRCNNPECGFEGCIADRGKVKKRVLLLFLVLIGIMALLIYGFVF